MSHGVWAVIGVLAGGTFLLKASGPVGLARRHLSARTTRVVAMLPPAVLAGLLISETFATDQAHQLTIDARAGGMIGAGVALWLRAPFVVVLVVAALVTALIRIA